MSIVVTAHAIERYRERVKPALGRLESGAELERVLEVAEIVEERPAWVGSHDPEATDVWALIGDGVALPLRRSPSGKLVAASCLTRGPLAPPLRAKRKKKRQARRARRLGRSSKATARAQARNRKRDGIERGAYG